MFEAACRASFLQTSRADVKFTGKPPLAVSLQKLPSGQHTHSSAPNLYARLPNGKVALHTRLQHGKRARSSAPAQHCAHASQLVSTLAHARPLSTARTPAKRSARTLKRTRSAPATRPARALKRTRSALYARLPKGQHTRSLAPAQHCTHTCQMVRKPAQVHLLSTVRLPNGKHTCSSAPAQQCMHACQMVSTTAQHGIARGHVGF